MLGSRQERILVGGFTFGYAPRAPSSMRAKSSPRESSSLCVVFRTFIMQTAA
jgi:hypothetical protein